LQLVWSIFLNQQGDSRMKLRAKSPILVTSLVFVVGVVAGSLLTAACAQRASYGWAGGRLGQLVGNLELDANRDAARGDREAAVREFSAAIEVRKQLAASQVEKLTWPFETPLMAAPEFLIFRSGPLLRIDEIYKGNDIVNFINDCALAVLANPGESEARNRALNAVTKKYPGSTATKCLAYGNIIWTTPIPSVTEKQTSN